MDDEDDDLRARTLGVGDDDNNEGEGEDEDEDEDEECMMSGSDVGEEQLGTICTGEAALDKGRLLTASSSLLSMSLDVPGRD